VYARPTGSRCAARASRMNRRTVIQPGGRYGRWLVLHRAANEPSGKSRWTCRCVCGTVAEVTRRSLRSGRSQSCGCQHADNETTHSHTSRRIYGRATGCSSEYGAYKNALHNCRNSNAQNYHLYGGRGIEVKFSSFQEFLACVGLRPAQNYFLSRNNKDGHFENGNVAWESRRPRKYRSKHERLSSMKNQVSL
jgi:hypothetical protein